MCKLTVAITQMASEHDWKKNCDKAEKLVRDAARQGAQLILLQELFDGDYFCIEQHTRFFRNAHDERKYCRSVCIFLIYNPASTWLLKLICAMTLISSYAGLVTINFTCGEACFFINSLIK